MKPTEAAVHPFEQYIDVPTHYPDPMSSRLVYKGGTEIDPQH
jgi:hypothetical protein